MSLTSAKTQVTKTCKTVNELHTKILPLLEGYQQTSTVELASVIEAVRADYRKLEQAAQRADKAMSNFEELSDKHCSPKDMTQDELNAQEDYSATYAKAIDDAQVLMTELLIIIERYERALITAPRAQTLQPSPQTGERIFIERSTLPMPKLPKFDGTLSQFQNFMHLFQETVHSSGQSDTLKLTHLVNSLSGEPFNLISKLLIREENYQKALQILEKKYGDQRKTIVSLVRKLQSLKSKSDKTSDQRELLDSVQLTVSQLVEMKEPLETIIIHDMIIQKFSNRIQMVVYKSKLKRDKTSSVLDPDKSLSSNGTMASTEWTINDILDRIEDFISMEEELEALVPRELKTSDHGQQKGENPSKGKDSKPKPSKLCHACSSKEHWTYECQTFPDPAQRTAILIAGGKCAQCARSDHVTSECTSPPCKWCNEPGHFSANCTKKQSANSSSNSTSSTQQTKSSTNSAKGSPNQGKPKGGKNHTVSMITTALDLETDVETRTSAFHAFERPKRSAAIIPTVKVPAFNPQSDSWENITLMLDTGADASYISQKLAETWKLPIIDSKTFAVKSFNDLSPTAKRRDQTYLELMTNRKKPIIIKPFIESSLVGKIGKNPISPQDLKYSNLLDLEINEQCHEEVVEPDVIIGGDYFNRIVGGPHTLPSGITLLDTVFGHTIMGRPFEDVSNEDVTHDNHLIPDKHQFIMVTDQWYSDRDVEEAQRRDMVMTSFGETTRPRRRNKAALIETAIGKTQTINSSSTRAADQVVPCELDKTVQVTRETPTDVPPAKDITFISEAVQPQQWFNLAAPSFSFGLPSRSNLLYLCTMFLIIGTAAGQGAQLPTHAVCIPTGIQIRGYFDSFEACVRDYCTSRSRLQWTNTDTVDVWIPPHLKTSPHHATVKIFDGHDLKTWELDCQSINVCDTIDCTFCLTNILNPECHLIYAIMGLGFTTFLTLFMIYALCCVPVKIVSVLKLGANLAMAVWTFIRSIVAYLWKKIGLRRRQINRFRTVAVIAALIIILPLGQACQEIDFTTALQQSCTEIDGKEKCETFTEVSVNLNQINLDGCIRISKNGTHHWDIRLQLEEVSLSCTKETITITQDVDVRVWSTKRCDTAGSCDDGKCTSINSDSLLPELQIANGYTGFTRCSESCGGFGCGCFFPSSGCLFYRVFAIPKTQQKYEVFRCMDYATTAVVKLTSTRLSGLKNTMRDFDLPLTIGAPVAHSKFVVTLDTVWTPPSPVLNTWFIRNENDTATWLPNHLPAYTCGEDATNCTLKDTCKCSPAEDTMMCSCEQDDLRQWFAQTDRRLPVHQGHWKLQTNNDNVIAKMHHGATATLTIKLHDEWKTTQYHTKDTCTVNPSVAIGCYSCENGATSEVLCTADTTETFASVKCGDDLFAIKCTINGAATNLTFYTNYAAFTRECTVSCGGEEQKFHIQGTLKFTASIWTSIDRFIFGNTTVYNEWNLPDIGHIFTEYMSMIKTVAIVLIVVVTIFLLTYSIIVATVASLLIFPTPTSFEVLANPFPPGASLRDLPVVRDLISELPRRVRPTRDTVSHFVESNGEFTVKIDNYVYHSMATASYSAKSSTARSSTTSSTSAPATSSPSRSTSMSIIPWRLRRLQQSS